MAKLPFAQQSGFILHGIPLGGKSPKTAQLRGFAPLSFTRQIR
jgi:hypothetical protein